MYSPNEMFAQNMVYEPLVKYGENGTIEPWLAQDWEISEDGKEYTFYLRENVTYSDGSKISAENEKMNFDAVLNNADRHDWIEVVNQIEETSVIDDTTFKITLTNAYYPLLQDLTLIRPFRFLGCNGFPDDGNTVEGIKEPIGTGPWVLQEYKRDEYALFKANENYWGELPNVQEVMIRVIPDGEARVLAFENKEIDLIFGTGLISLDSFNFLKESNQYETGISGPLSTRTLAVNSNNGPTKELKVRQAIQHSFNKQALIDRLFYGTDEKADTLFASNVPYSDLGLTPYDYNLEQADRLLNEAGWELAEGETFREKDGEILELELAFSATDNLQKAIAETLQGDLRQAGISLKLVGEEAQSYQQRQKDGDFHLIFNNTWGAPYEPHTFASSMRVPAHADYQAQFGLPMKAEIDQEISEVLISSDEKVRQEKYEYILGTLHEQAVYLPISYSTNIAVYHDYVSGVEFPHMNYVLPLETIDVE
jgi:nickel transport system substrate-binding protein